MTIKINLFFDMLFKQPTGKVPRWMLGILIAAIFIGGFVLWGVYFNWGNFPSNYHDWATITFPRLTFLQKAIQTGVLPLHIADTLPLADSTNRFLAMPDQILSPQIFLLKWLSVSQFVMVDVWLLYFVSFWGLLWLRKKFNLSIIAFFLLFLLFNFNGQNLAQLTAGHLWWGAYFLFPWFIGLIFELLQKGGGWNWVTKVAGLLFIVFLNGGYHFFIWALFFIGFLAVAVQRHFWTLLKTAVFVVLLSAVRILPLFLPLGEFHNKYIAGYPFVQTIWTSLVTPQIPNDLTYATGFHEVIGTWEFSLYVGLFAAVFLLYFGLFRVLRTSEKQNLYIPILVPVMALGMLSLGKVYQYLRVVLPIPLITGERVSSRIISLAFIFLLTLAIIEFQRLLDNLPEGTTVKILSLGLIVYITNDLWQNFQIWKIAKASKLFPIINLDMNRFYPIAQPDLKYALLLGVGLAITLISVAVLFVLRQREDKKELLQNNNPGPVQ